ncbi:MAG: YeeE/YedE thiosulfate transporter family protein [Deltaproteobacteria bacterium]|nr:YeeE/YedE thiosulfate transporter family protein [Deltaproteobacteria bacterium]
MTPVSPSFDSFLHDQYNKVFARPWPVIPSALVIAALNVFLFAFDRPWTASDGVRNWGDGLMQAVGIINQPDLLPPSLYSGSVLNLGLIFGALAAALLSREFAVRPAPPNELLKGALGGLLMGLGAMLSFGCNIGGFFSALSALSLSGVAMMAGLYLGAFAGARFTIRENARLIAAGQIPYLSTCEAPPRPAPASAAYRFQPVLGFLLLLTVVGAASLYKQAGHARLGMFLLFGAAFGVVFQRSRFCLVRAFREPFMTGESEHARAGALALTLSMIGFAILKASDLKDAGEWVFPSFWQGSLFGGTLFGFGMVIAGGCGAGSLWRAGEGHIKLWIAVLFFALGASAMRQLLVRTEWIRRLGSAVFLPDEIGWVGAAWSVVLLMALWYLLSGWNEQRKGAGLLKF